MYGPNTILRSQTASLFLHVGVVTLAFLFSVRAPGTNTAARMAANGPLLMPSEWFVRQRHDAGSGGGGTQSPLRASRGQLPRATPNPYTPPLQVPVNPEPRLIKEPGILAQEEVRMPESTSLLLGDPRAPVGPPSNGRGRRGGIGDGCCEGIGDHNGPGYGDQPHGKGFGNRALPLETAGLVKPVLLYRVDPEYTDQARQAKLTGVIKMMIVML